MLSDFTKMSDDFKQGLQVALLNSRSDLINSPPISNIQNLQDLNGYGCWCYFDDNNSHKGKGLAQDSTFDLACRNLRHGYECAQLDTGISFDCKPWNVTYNSALFCEKDILESCCETFNKNSDGSRNDCAYYACLTENHFVKEVINLVVKEGESLDDSLVWDNGFNSNEQCVPVQAATTIGNLLTTDDILETTALVN